MRARKPKPVKENSERWLLTYADLITLLMVFFILLFAMSSTNTRKFQDLTGALEKAFNNGQFQLIQIGGAPGSPKRISGATPGERQDFKRIQRAMRALSKELGLQPRAIHVGMNKEGVVITIAGNLLFFPGDTMLRPQSEALLSRIAPVMRGLRNVIRVEGNTDDEVLTGSLYTSNWDLSALRATSIVKYLAGPGRLMPWRLEAEGLSQYHPVASNATPAGRARNRRADIVILYP